MPLSDQAVQEAEEHLKKALEIAEDLDGDVAAGFVIGSDGANIAGYICQAMMALGMNNADK